MLIKLNYFFNSTRTIFKRFPFVILFAIVCSAFSYLTIVYDKNEQFVILTEISILGMLIFLCLHLYFEIYETFLSKLVWTGLGLLFLTIYYYSNLDITTHNHYLYFFTFLSAFILLFFSSYNQKITVTEFWNFSQIIINRILINCILGIVLFFGLMLFFDAIEAVFSFTTDKNFYWFIISTIVICSCTLFFLAGIPNTAQIKAYSADGFRISKYFNLFVLYILTPFMVIYLFISYIFLIRLLVTWHIPGGVTSTLLLSFSFLSLLNLILLFPFHKEGKSLVRHFKKYLPLLSLPLLCLLVLAMILRVRQYGFTENRYLVIVLSLWFIGIYLYLVSNRLKNIKVLPLSLAILLFFCNLGYLGMYAVSENSQVNQIISIFDKYQVLQKNKFIKPLNQAKLSKHEIQEITDILYFLERRKALKRLYPYMSKKFRQSVKEDINIKNKVNTALSFILDKTPNYLANKRYKNFTFQAKPQLAKPLNIKKYNQLIHFVFDNKSVNSQENITINNTKYTVKVSFKDNSILIKRGKLEMMNSSLQMMLEELVKNKSKKKSANKNFFFEAEPYELTLIEESVWYKAKIIIKTIDFVQKKKKVFEIKKINFTLIIKFSK